MPREKKLARMCLLSACACACAHAACVYICMRRGVGIIRHCLIYSGEVSVAGWDPLHLSPFLNGVSTAPTPAVVPHFNDCRNDSACV